MYKYVVCDIVKRFVSNMAWTWEFVPLMLPFMHTDRFCPLGRGGSEADLSTKDFCPTLLQMYFRTSAIVGCVGI